MESNDLKQAIASLKSLSPSQQRVVFSLIAKMRRPITSTLLAERAPFTAEFVTHFGNVFVAHHAMSAQPFTKDKFEWAMVTALTDCGVEAEHGPRGLPGYDIVVGLEKWSLKTQADRHIKLDRIHISKFMEFGNPPMSKRTFGGVNRLCFRLSSDQDSQNLAMKSPSVIGVGVPSIG